MYLKYINKICGNLIKRQCSCTIRKLHQNSNLHSPGAYEASGKTTVQVMNKDTEIGIMIDGFSQVGFKLNNDFTILGSMVIFPRSVLSWNVEDVSEITEQTLSLFTILEPKIDILVLGVGDRLQDFSLYTKILPFTRKHRMSLEVMPTEQACATFNFLTTEGRNVAGALIPPKIINTSEDDEMESKLRYQNLYG
ncbi:unnamed protein product [Phyllotreta striolata]|uniref:NADH dehydrogenase [ubiquinone] 1 alpha subcomplex assembly factor 3 n=1 Tax=Phyllotreta striolata TaxID=444603 RepID=A0A9N9TK78_PHYSR|nr:unnamed protein product [Phyllotreta striolata]